MVCLLSILSRLPSFVDADTKCCLEFPIIASSQLVNQSTAEPDNALGTVATDPSSQTPDELQGPIVQSDT